MRPIMSIVLPAEKGTMARIGFAVGQAACAKLERASAGAPRTAAENFRKLRRLCVGMFPPKYAPVCCRLSAHDATAAAGDKSFVQLHCIRRQAWVSSVHPRTCLAGSDCPA